jgi:hypothetical protein
MHLVFYGTKYRDESDGVLGVYYDELTGNPVDFYDIGKELATGMDVHIRPATEVDLPPIEAKLAVLKAQQAARASEVQSVIDRIDQVMASVFPETTTEPNEKENKHAG